MLYLLFVYRSTLQGLGDTVTPMISGVVELVMRIGNALLLPLLIGEWGVYFAEISAWIGAAIFLIFGYYRRMRILSRPIRRIAVSRPRKSLILFIFHTQRGPFAQTGPVFMGFLSAGSCAATGVPSHAKSPAASFPK